MNSKFFKRGTFLGAGISQSVIVGNSKQRINFDTGCITNVSFWELDSNFGIFKQALENSPNHLWFKRCCNEKLLKLVKN